MNISVCVFVYIYFFPIPTGPFFSYSYWTLSIKWERGRKKKKRLIFKNWLMQMLGLATLKSTGKASMPETQARAGVAGLSTKYVGQANRISTQVRFFMLQS